MNAKIMPLKCCSRKEIHLFLIIGFLHILASVQIHAQTYETMVERFQKNVVQLTIKLSDGQLCHGFGFVIGERGQSLYVVTANHLVRSENFDEIMEIKARFFDDQGKPVSALLLNLETTFDLALLEVPKPFKNYTWEKQNIPSSPYVSDTVWFIGRNREWYIPTDKATGSINRLTPQGVLHVDITSVWSGCIGSPLLTKNGIIGMITDDEPYEVIALNIETIRQIVMHEWNYPWQLDHFQSGINSYDSTLTEGRLHESSQVGDTIAHRLMNNVVHLTATFADGKQSNGFGFVVGEQHNELFVITAYHVVYTGTSEITKEVLVEFYEYPWEKSFSAELLMDVADLSLDIALLKIPKPLSYHWERKSICPKFRRGDKIWFIGKEPRDLGKHKLRLWYVPSDDEAEVLRDDEPDIDGYINFETTVVRKGTSGAPLFTKDGIIGMIVEKSIKYPEAGAIHIDWIRKLVTMNRYPWDLQVSCDK